MPGKTFTVEVKPAVLRWARESAGYSQAEVAERIEQSEREIAAWETGSRRPSWPMLRNLSSVYKRPVASLLLPAPPAEPPQPPDFRTRPDAKGVLSPNTRYAMRIARWLGRTASDLEQQLGFAAKFKSLNINSSDNPELIARQSRDSLGISVEEQVGWQNLHQALNHWRAVLEGQGILVFQFKMPLDEVQGFSLFEADQPVIVLNQTDAIAARVFTLFHEYAHLLMAHPGICLPEEGMAIGSKGIETFCNRFAAAFLIPRDDFEPRMPTMPQEQTINQLARRYQVSRFVVLGRMQTLGAISSQTYQHFAQRWKRREQPASARIQRGGPTATTRCLSQKGPTFVSLVLQAAKRDVITINDAASYLGIKLKDFRKLAGQVP